MHEVGAGTVAQGVHFVHVAIRWVREAVDVEPGSASMYGTSDRPTSAKRCCTPLAA